MKVKNTSDISDDIKVDHNKSTNQSLECRYKDFLFYNLLQWHRDVISLQNKEQTLLCSNTNTHSCVSPDKSSLSADTMGVSLLTSPHFCPLSCDAERGTNPCSKEGLLFPHQRVGTDGSSAGRLALKSFLPETNL